MQYDRASDGTMTPLPAPCVDTGMGIERIAAVLQGVHSNYDTDLFEHLIKAAARATGAKDLQSNSLKVIADHIRATAFLIADGVIPSNEGRGYVLRRIMRRAIRHGYQLGQDKPFFHKLVAALDEEMGDAYPELHKQYKQIEKIILDEELRFAATLDRGMAILREELDIMGALDLRDVKNQRAQGIERPRIAYGSRKLSGKIAFILYDTYGFPLDLTEDVCRENGVVVDVTEFNTEMDKQRERARAASKFGADYSREIEVDEKTKFSGYEHTEEEASITALFHGDKSVKKLSAGEEGLVVLDHTPFYGESGGQVGDTGILAAKDARFLVSDTQKRGDAHVHVGRLEQGALKIGDAVHAQVDAERRAAIVRNHSATHLLHAALRKLLGEHVTQKGSLVAPDRLRFDFSHAHALSPEQLIEIEDLVNAEILGNVAADVSEKSYDEAIQSGAMALFGEKYGDTVRVMRFGDFSTELCGGTHVARTGDIGLFKIVAESGIAAGIRRIEAVTGVGALAFVREQERRLGEIAALVKAGREDAAERVRQLAERARSQEKELTDLRRQLAAGRGGDLAAQAVDVAGHKVLVARLDGADAQALRAAVDGLKAKLGSAAIVLGTADGGKVRLAAGVTPDLAKRLPAGELANIAAVEVGGRGGGRADFAQAGGTEPDKLDSALAQVLAWAKQRLAS